jgi:hypothetical protein
MLNWWCTSIRYSVDPLSTDVADNLVIAARELVKIINMQLKRRRR